MELQLLNCNCQFHTYSRNESLSDQHAKDVSECDGLSSGLFAPQSLYVVGDVLRQEQSERVATHTLHQLLVDPLWTLLGELGVRVQRGHIPGREGGRKL